MFREVFCGWFLFLWCVWGFVGVFVEICVKDGK